MLKMVVKSLKFFPLFWNDMVYLDDFGEKLIIIRAKKESRIDVDVYYIGYIGIKLQYNIYSVNLCI